MRSIGAPFEGDAKARLLREALLTVANRRSAH